MNRKRKIDESQDSPSIKIKKISKKDEKNLDNRVLKFANEYTQHFYKDTQNKWSITRGFVTNIVEFNQNFL